MKRRPAAETEPGISRTIGTPTQVPELGVTVAVDGGVPVHGGMVNSNAPKSEDCFLHY
jgi:hypothetical protein